MDQLRILIADDDHHVRAGLRAFLSTVLWCEIVGTAANGSELFAQVAQHRPHVVLLDLGMPAFDGVQATRILKTCWPETAVLVLTLHREQRDVMLAAGADAFVAKGDPPRHMLDALQTIQHGLTTRRDDKQACNS